MTTGEIVVYVVMAVLIVLYIYLYSYLKEKAKNLATKDDIKDISYESEKGKNTATKEDVQVITERVESIKNNFNKSIEQLKADLTKKNIAYEVDYSFYNTERAKALIDLYRKLAKAYETGLYMGGIWKLYQENSIDLQIYKTMRLDSITKYIEALGQAGSAITFCRVYLDRDLCLEIKEFNNKVGKYANQYLDAISQDDDGINKLLELYDEFTGFVIELYDFAERIRALIQPENNEDK